MSASRLACLADFTDDPHALICVSANRWVVFLAGHENYCMHGLLTVSPYSALTVENLL